MTAATANPREYALLKDRLPSRSRLKFDHWVALRCQCWGG